MQRGVKRGQEAKTPAAGRGRRGSAKEREAKEAEGRGALLRCAVLPLPSRLHKRGPLRPRQARGSRCVRWRVQQCVRLPTVCHRERKDAKSEEKRQRRGVQKSKEGKRRQVCVRAKPRKKAVAKRHGRLPAPASPPCLQAEEV